MNLVCVCTVRDVAVLMCLKTADVTWEDVWGIMLTWRCGEREWYIILIGIALFPTTLALNATDPCTR